MDEQRRERMEANNLAEDDTEPVSRPKEVGTVRLVQKKKYTFKKTKDQRKRKTYSEPEDSDIPSAQPRKYFIHTSQTATSSRGNFYMSYINIY